MKSTLAVLIIATLAPCLLAIERITAAPPEAPPATPCKECCGDSCAEPSCKGTPQDTETATATPCAKDQCCNGTCDSPSQKQVSIDASLALPLPPAAPSAISFSAFPQPCAGTACGHSACASAPAAMAATSACCEQKPQKTVIYSAIPAGVPSPFVNGPDCPNPSRLLIASQPYSFNWPLQQPPAPISQMSADIIVEHPIAYAPSATSAPASEKAVKAKQVLYNIQIIEDREGCLCEYESFRDGDCIMFADSNTLLPALRIMQKHNLVDGVSSPKLICTTGHRAQIEVGGEVSTDGNKAWEGVKIQVEAEEFDKGLKVEFAVHTSQNERTCDVRTAVVIDAGQTVVLKSHGAAGGGSKEGSQQAIYVVLTPELIK
jgi:hypothetical protein